MKTIKTKPNICVQTGMPCGVPCWDKCPVHQRGDYIWTDINKTQVKWEANPEGRFIMGCDPYYTPNWWEKILIWLGIMEDKSSKATILPLPKDYVEMKNIKINHDANNKN